MATLRRRVAAIARAHRVAGHRLYTGHPAIRETLRGTARHHGTSQRRAAALSTPKYARSPPFAAALSPACATGRCCCSASPRRFRRSDVAAVEAEHLRFTGDGLELLLPRSTPPPAASPTLPRASLRSWRTIVARILLLQEGG